MFGWFKDRPRKTAIRIKRIYNGIDMQPQIVAAPPDVTKVTISDMKNHPKRYAWDVKMKDGLSDRPKIQIADLAHPERLKEHDVDVICEVTYTFTSEIIQPKHRLAKVVMFLIIWAFLGFLGLMFWFAEQSKQERIDSQCYYKVNGEPTSITIQGETYKLDADGSINDVDRVFLNPFHEELLKSMSDDDCIVIDTKGDTL